MGPTPVTIGRAPRRPSGRPPGAAVPAMPELSDAMRPGSCRPALPSLPGHCLDRARQGERVCLTWGGAE
jgi:hypothetical protein